MNNHSKGFLSLIFLTALYGTYGVFNRLIGSSFSVFSQQMVRNFLVLLFVFIIALIFKAKFQPIKRKNIFWFLSWMFAGSLVMIFLFIAFNQLKLSTVYLLFYSTMITSGVICGKIFYNEKLDRIKIVSLIFSLVGLFFVYSLTISKNEIYPAILSLSAGLLLGYWNSISKKFSSQYSELQLVFFDAFASFILGFTAFFLFRETLPILEINLEWFWITAYAFVQVFSVGLLIYGFKNMEAQVASLIMPIEIIFASIFAAIFFSEFLSFYGLVGGIFILTGAFLPNAQIIRNFLKHR